MKEKTSKPAPVLTLEVFFGIIKSKKGVKLLGYMQHAVDDRIAQKVEEVSEEIMLRTYKRAETTTIILLEKADENITKMCAAMLYQVVLGLFEDYYNVRKGRKREAWEKELCDHITLLRKVSEILIYYGISSRDEIDDFIFENSFSDDVDFPRVATVADGLLRQLHEFDTMAIFRC